MAWQKASKVVIQDMITDNARMVGVALSAYLSAWYGEVPSRLISGYLVLTMSPNVRRHTATITGASFMPTRLRQRCCRGW